MSGSPRSVPEEGSQRPSPRAIPGWITVLAERARAVDGTPPFSDGALVDYRTGARELVAIDEIAAALVGPTEAELVVGPDDRGRGLGTRLLEELLAATSGTLLIWAHGDHPAARALAASHHLIAARELLHLTAEVPKSVSVSGSPIADLGTSGDRIEIFESGRDEDEWIALNHRIFEHHGEQGQITRPDLELLEAEDWFRADDFLVLRRGDAMIGYCWVKVTTDSEGGDARGDARGEIYVVGVSPDFQGEKLGARMFDAGLTRMREQHIRHAHLYVDGDNIRAISLYESRGFTRDSIDIQYSTAPAL